MPSDSSLKVNDGSMPLWLLIRDGVCLLTKKERWIALCLVGLILLSGGLDVVALAMVMPVVAVIMEPALLEQQQWLIWVSDGLAVNGSHQFVLVAVLLAGGLLLGAAAFNLVLLRLGHRFEVTIQARLSRELMLATLKAPYAWHIKQNSAVLLRFFHSDVEMWGQSFILRLIQMSQYLVGMLLPLVLFAVLAPSGAMLGVVGVGIVGVLIARAVKPRLSRAGLAAKEISKGLMVRANNAISGIKDVKLAGGEEKYASDFAGEFRRRAQAGALLSFWPVAQSNSMLLLGQLTVLGLAASYFFMGLSHGQIAGNMALVILVVCRVLPSANRFLNLYSSMWSVLPFVEEVVQIRRDLEAVSEELRTDGPPVGENWKVIRVNQVSFRYPKQSDLALDSVSIKLHRGGFYGVVGESGAGKSTLIDLAVGLYKPSAGRIEVGGQDLSESDLKSWHQQIGYVPQFPYLMDATIAENISLGLSSKNMDSKEILQALELANLAEFIRGLPEGLNTPVGDRGVRLSGGQRQRLAIARALFQKPQLLVLDEATSSLDQIAESEIRTALEKLHGRITVIMIAHRMTTVQDCDEILYLSNGKLVAQGRYEELLATHDGFQRLACADVHHTN